MKKKKRITTSGENQSALEQSPFASLSSDGLPPSGVEPSSKPDPNQPESTPGKGQRIEIRREKAGRCGKTVTTLNGFENLSEDQ